MTRKIKSLLIVKDKNVEDVVINLVREFYDTGSLINMNDFPKQERLTGQIHCGLLVLDFSLGLEEIHSILKQVIMDKISGLIIILFQSDFKRMKEMILEHLDNIFFDFKHLFLVSKDDMVEILPKIFKSHQINIFLDEMKH